MLWYIGEEIIDNSSGVRQSAKIVFDDEFLSSSNRCNKKNASTSRLDDRIIEGGQNEKQDGISI